MNNQIKELRAYAYANRNSYNLNNSSEKAPDRFSTRDVRCFRARKDDISEALSLRVHDPLWLLARQWQLGEFRGNNAGTAMGVRGKYKSWSVQPNEREGLTANEPIEPYVEGVAAVITPSNRIEAALHFMNLAAAQGLTANDLLPRMMSLCPLREDCYNLCGVEDVSVKEYALTENTRLKKFYNAYRNKAFDGYTLYLELSDSKTADKYSFLPQKLISDYIAWFKQKYNQTDNKSWQMKQLGYDMQVATKGKKMVGQNYTGGRLSWYSFDSSQDSKGNSNPVETKTFTSLPSLATFSSAPSKRLWEFEDHKVYMGNSTEQQSQGNALLMQYVTMYSNDWMLIPIATQMGRYIEVEEIVIRDTFGQQHVITNMAGLKDKNNATFDQRWRMFSIAPENYLSIEHGATPKVVPEMKGLLLPPVLPDTVEGKPVEEIQFLRDEMANMIWAVETLLPDGTGQALNATDYARAINRHIEESNESLMELKLKSLGMLNGETKIKVNDETDEQNVSREGVADFKYVIQNTVPLNWIPFIPQQVKTSTDKEVANRDTILRRAKMPCFIYKEGTNVNQQYQAVHPVSSLLKPELNSDGKEKTPLYINEEEILQTGIKVVKNYQRARWFNGKPYNWIGISKQLSKNEADSGLTFDKLINPN